MSRQALANAVGVTRLTIHSIETGKFGPSALLALKIARFFWLDEKQSIDVGRAALVTVLLALPLLWIGYAAQSMVLPAEVVGDLWFPATAFLMLSVFSISAVWFSRRA
jgi:DNA-binding XRE family transcriptional regulator